MFQLPSSSLVTTLHVAHHEFVFCSLMWTLVDVQWVTFLCNYIAIRAESWKKFWKCFSSYFTVRSLLSYEIYKSPPHRIIVVLCSGCFLSVFIHHDAAYKSAEKIVYCFGCGWKGEVSFGRKGRSKNCIILIMCISSVPNFCESFAFGTVCIKIWLLMLMYFPFPVSGNIFL